MDREQLVDRHPILYHMADARNWANIRRAGLLSTTALLDERRISGTDREAIESRHRPATVAIEGGGPGVAWVRDQRPLDPGALAGCLDDMTPAEWYETLNGRVFFWPTRDRLDGMLRAYAREEQAVIEVDTRRLLDRHGDRVALSHINSGYAHPDRRPARRGRSTFVPIDLYAHSSKNAIAEVTVPHSVPDLFEAVLRVTSRRRGRADLPLWPDPPPVDAAALPPG